MNFVTVCYWSEDQYNYEDIHFEGSMTKMEAATSWLKRHCPEALKFGEWSLEEDEY